MDEDEELIETQVPTVGERLRAAREEKKLSLEDIAAQTRIPQRHLESIENAEWDKLPAPTYTTGFAKSYASAVGLDRTEIGDQLRSEMGGQRPLTAPAEIFEPADPARTMPKTLVFGAIAAVLVIVLVMSWLSRRSLEQPDDTANTAVAAAPTAVVAPPPAPVQPTAPQPVVITATDLVWMQVYEKGGATYFSGVLQPGQRFSIPPNSTAPQLKTGKPEALQITVGAQVAPPVGPPAKKVSDVSLLPNDLLHPAAAQPPQAAPATPPATRPRNSAGNSAPPPAAPADANAPTTNSGE